jgi:ribosome biogenesis GTPase
MNNEETALVLKKQADLFTVELPNGQISTCVARKNLKRDGIFVGDRVVLDDDGTICKLEKRKNVLVRPPVANIDRMFIVLAPIPKPDLFLVDKLILFCETKGIAPVVCINKKDLDEKYCKILAKIYKKVAKVVISSTLDDSVVKIQDNISGVCALAGQSAVGKSSIINALTGRNVAQVDTFSKKIERGKQTTRTVELFKFGQNQYLADTAGFSKLDESLLELKPEEIRTYYPEFAEFASECKYSSCLHNGDKNCAVLQAVEHGEIEKSRYENYLKLLEIVKNIKKY